MADHRFVHLWWLALGHAGDGFSLVRRVGVVLYFSLTFICELLVSAGLRSHPLWVAFLWRKSRFRVRLWAD